MIILPNDTVYFNASEDELTYDGMTLTRLQADPIIIHNITNLLIEGHCDPQEGTYEYCLALGERRANNVRSFLLSYLKKYFNYENIHIEIVSYGKERPMYIKSTEKNQRTVTIPR